LPVLFTRYVCQLHSATFCKAQGRIKRKRFFSADDTNAFKTQFLCSCSSSKDVIGVRATKGEQRFVSQFFCFFQIILQLPPLVSRNVWMIKVLPLNQNTHTGFVKYRIIDFLYRGLCIAQHFVWPKRFPDSFCHAS